MKRRFWLSLLGVAVLMGSLLTVSSQPATANDGLAVGDVVRFFDREGSIGGGEFGVAKLPNLTAEIFRTFCVQRDEYLDFDPAGFRVVGITGKVQLQNQDLNFKTAWLYSQFRAGTLSGYDYTPNSAARIASADALQAAIWHLENESGYTNFASLSAAAQNFVNLAVAANPQDLGNVRVVNLVWTTTRSGFQAGAAAQDVLTIIPEPAFFQMGALIAFGGLGYARLRKRS